MRKLTREEFIAKASLANKDKGYDYSNVVYVNNNTKVEIICPIHGSFMSRPDHLTKGRGCKKCCDEERGLNNRLTKQKFIYKLEQIVDQTKYDLSKVEYVTYDEKIIVTCKVHGDFLITPRTLLRGCGCSLCMDTGFNPGKPAKLYIHNIVNCQHSFTGFGITRNLKARTSSHTKNLNRDGYIIAESFISDEMDGKFIQQLENVLKETFPTDPATSHLDGFKRESTTAPFHEVVTFVQQYIEQHKEPHGDNRLN